MVWISHQRKNKYIFKLEGTGFGMFESQGASEAEEMG